MKNTLLHSGPTPDPGCMSHLVSRPRSELSQDELAQLEQYEMTHGPMAQLTEAVRSGAHVLISCRSGRKVLGRVRAFDRHFNMVLEDSREIWTPPVRKGKCRTAAKPYNRERFVSKMFLRGDSVVLVVFTSPEESC